MLGRREVKVRTEEEYMTKLRPSLAKVKTEKGVERKCNERKVEER